MVHGLRMAMHVKRAKLGKDELFHFLLSLRTWHQGMLHRTKKEQFLVWLKLRGSHDRCMHMTVDDNDKITFCHSSGSDGFVWCHRHRPRQTEIEGNYRREIKMLCIPIFLKNWMNNRKLHIMAVGYFEQRWSATNWDCSLSNLDSQLQVAAPVGTDVWKMCILRFHGLLWNTAVTGHVFTDTHVHIDSLTAIVKTITDRQMWNRMFGMNILVFDIIETDMELRFWDEEVRSIPAVILKHVSLLQWSQSIIVIFGYPIHLVTRTSVFNNDRDSFLNTLENAFRGIYEVPLLCIVLQHVDHLEWVSAFVKSHSRECTLHIVFPVDVDVGKSIQTHTLDEILLRPQTDKGRARFTQLPDQAGRLAVLRGCNTYLTYPYTHGVFPNTITVKKYRTSRGVVYADPNLRLNISWTRTSQMDVDV